MRATISAMSETGSIAIVAVIDEARVRICPGYRHYREQRRLAFYESDKQYNLNLRKLDVDFNAAALVIS